MQPKAAFHEVLKVKFFDVSQRFTKGVLGCDAAADILGVSVSTLDTSRHTMKRPSLSYGKNERSKVHRTKITCQIYAVRH